MWIAGKEKLYSLADIAAIRKIGAQTARFMIKAGDLEAPALRIGPTDIWTSAQRDREILKQKKAEQRPDPRGRRSSDPRLPGL